MAFSDDQSRLFAVSNMMDGTKNAKFNANGMIREPHHLTQFSYPCKDLVPFRGRVVIDLPAKMGIRLEPGPRPAEADEYAFYLFSALNQNGYRRANLWEEASLEEAMIRVSAGQGTTLLEMCTYNYPKRLIDPETRIAIRRTTTSSNNSGPEVAHYLFRLHEWKECTRNADHANAAWMVQLENLRLRSSNRAFWHVQAALERQNIPDIHLLWCNVEVYGEADNAHRVIMKNDPERVASVQDALHYVFPADINSDEPEDHRCTICHEFYLTTPKRFLMEEKRGQELPVWMDCACRSRTGNECLARWLLENERPTCPFCRTKIDILSPAWSDFTLGWAARLPRYHARELSWANSYDVPFSDDDEAFTLVGLGPHYVDFMLGEFVHNELRRAPTRSEILNEGEQEQDRFIITDPVEEYNVVRDPEEKKLAHHSIHNTIMLWHGRDDVAITRKEFYEHLLGEVELYLRANLGQPSNAPIGTFTRPGFHKYLQRLCRRVANVAQEASREGVPAHWAYELLIAQQERDALADEVAAYEAIRRAHE
ncbi:hypothetical protein NA57DRAFT_53343 [Rhizodiscina lignyota]|uniref:RING-type domain-containing protein n=1 Tax=Rhizodiscina lignyota TaxID=1504668 RepID=A0A9P4IMX4_9PEZI|nr:hypothetical protein NA57DRAFT_53343 [Rhizodiscina lignyota]